MAKKVRQIYFFQPGIPLSSNRKPNAYSFINSNLEFIKDEAEAYVFQQKAANNAPFIGYTYTSSALQNDVAAIVNAVIFDIRYGGNAATRTQAASYWAGATAKISGTRLAELDYINYVKTLVTTYIITNTNFPSLQSPVVTTQTLFGGVTAEASIATTINSLFTIVTDVIQNGLSSLPELSNNLISSIEVLGKVGLEDLLLITNVTDNVVIYNFADNSKGASVSFTANNTINFPNATTVDNGTTTIYLNFNTDSMSASDTLQIFEESEQIVRLNDIATDAIERMRVARPQAMIDADFEYGLQPTKWQAIATQRGYPSTYEIPGSEKVVTSITTDASTPTAGVGPSLLTVTTQGAHGFTAGDAFAIKALSSSISGFSRAEGNFTVQSVPSTTTFTYYSKAKVGTSSGQECVTSTTLLREADFYTGAQVGNVNFSVFSNGSSGSITTILAAPSGSQRVTFTGTVPPINSPITSALTTGSTTFITTGTQITSNVGTGGTVATYYTTTDASIGATSLTLASVSGLQVGMAIDRGDGTQALITNIIGNLIVLNTALTSTKQGDVQTYNDLAITEIVGTGSGATLDIDKTGGVYSVSSITSAGSGYNVGDTLRILGADLGGVTGDNQNYVTPTLTEILPTGTSATFNVTKSSGVYTAVTINAAGSGYFTGDLIIISGSSLGGTSAHDLAIAVTGVTNDTTGGAITTLAFVGTANGTGSYSAVSGTNSLSGSTGLNITVNRTNGVYSVTSISSGGVGYIIGGRFKILGTDLDGTSPTNDAIVRITSTTGSLDSVFAASISGNAVVGTDLILNVTSIGGSGTLTGVTIKSGSGSGTATYTSVNSYNISGGASGALVHVTRNAGVYSLSIAAAGTNYVVGQRYKILGTSLEGATTANDLSLTVATVSGSANGVATFTLSGTAIRGSTTIIYSTIALSANTINACVASNTINYSSIATLQATFDTPHGFVPGMTFLAIINSDNGANNHTFASGPFFVDNIPSSTTIRYTARAPGLIKTLSNDSTSNASNLTGRIYVRPDAFFIHRPFDGGVQLGTGGPQHGGQAIRQSKKYIRYQSGKGAMYNTGALFAPSFNIRSITATSTAIGSVITITTDDTDHGLQSGSSIKLTGVTTVGFNGTYIINSVIDERNITVLATEVLGHTNPEIGIDCKLSLFLWSGAVVRSGPYDDQNGIFWQYDGKYMGVGRRTSTFQIAGTSAINANSNTVTGTNTRFLDQLKTGDRITIRGMTHVVTNITSQTAMSVSPDFRGVNNVSGVSVCKIQDLIIPQTEWNLDKCDGTGPSGYILDPTKMQMIGIQFSWYGAGFIDWMLRGPDGNYLFVHRLKGNNLNTEAYMRTGNAPVRYEVLNETQSGRLDGALTDSQNTITVDNLSNFPDSGTLYIDNEIINYTGRNLTTNTFTGCVRGSTFTNFNAGTNRTYSAGAAAAHDDNKGVILLTCTCSPIISHWGSAYLIDGEFDEDRGYIFNYAQTNLTVSATKQTAFMLRLAPSVSNAIVGDLGERELLNRAQLLLDSLEITSDTGATGTLVIEGILNPQNYPLDPGSVSWSSLTGLSQGGQPSFAQVAAGGSISWSAGGGTVTTTATTTSSMTATATTYAASYNYVRTGPFSSTLVGSNIQYLTEASFEGKGIIVGCTITTAGFSNAVVNSIQDNGAYYTIILSAAASGPIYSGTTLTFSLGGASATKTSILYFTKSTWEASGAVNGSLIDDVKFPANTRVAAVSSLLNFGSTDYYKVTFTQTSLSSTSAGGTVTFSFTQPAYALPGETIFSFIANAGEMSKIDLSKLKELTTTTLGGRGAFPNGPDVLAINIYKVSGTDAKANLLLRWGEAQA
jgi:hypothetical protein